jgi:hypothetical protein
MQIQASGADPGILGLEVLRFSIVERPDGIAGDFDADGEVDGADFLVWQRNPAVGNLADWKTNYGTGSLTASIAVPEPAAGLLLLGLMGLVPSRRFAKN